MDQALQRELREQPRGTQHDEHVVRSADAHDAADDDEAEHRDEQQGRDEARLLARHREDEIGVRVGQRELDLPVRGTRAEQAAVAEASSDL